MAESGETADDRHQEEREGDGRASARTPADAHGVRAVEKNFEYRRLQNRGVLYLFAGSRRAGEDENASANDSTDAQRGEANPTKRLFQAFFGVFGFGDQVINIFAAKEL